MAALCLSSQQIASSSGLIPQHRHTSWQPPKQGTIKINMDAAFVSPNHTGAIASIFRDHTGKMLDGFTLTVPAFTATEAETQALLQTLKHLIHQQQTDSHLQLESDSLILVDIVNSSRLPPWSCRALFAEIDSLLLCFPHLSLHHCPRESNALADWACKAHGRGLLPLNWALKLRVQCMI
ncbi:uncharacterized protein LOC120294426 [Eucalyptus grandis]|uniref:uncharacterized protein LOC120294426 n=1 Tax=Eucalyptus grandis TaxID=71139 RepID=UPI00192EDDD3|nr:uncharacterized protein LOC120294426 [Eucalyptus grandis]